MKTAAIIPARMGSTRFPGKVLALLGGKPIVQWVWERTKASKADEVIVASDSEEVIRAVEAFGGKAQMTSPNHPSGSDRIWEVASKLDCDIIINVQGDEPFMEPSVIDRLIDVLASMGGTEKNSNGDIIFEAGSIIAKVDGASVEDLENMVDKIMEIIRRKQELEAIRNYA